MMKNWTPLQMEEVDVANLVLRCGCHNSCTCSCNVVE